jgi:hypothetical protein
MRVQSGGQRFCGRRFTPKELTLIRDVVQTCAGVSRQELANTVCELLGWKRASGALKGEECGDFLERLEADGILALPQKQQGRPVGSKTSIPITERGNAGTPLDGRVEEFTPLVIERVQSREQRLLFRELVGRHHYLGYAVPFGARLQYLVFVSKPVRTVVGCMQFSSPAWRMQARDQWVGWDDATRQRKLQHVVNNSRFLILPWVRIRNLATSILSAVVRLLRVDWQKQYGVDPWLVETLVDQERFHGGSYRAANWIVLGQTSGRGRMDREHQRHGAEIKTLLVYPLVREARQQLREGGGD